jgi:hypothetical protein
VARGSVYEAQIHYVHKQHRGLVEPAAPRHAPPRPVQRCGGACIESSRSSSSRSSSVRPHPAPPGRATAATGRPAGPSPRPTDAPQLTLPTDVFSRWASRPRCSPPPAPPPSGAALLPASSRALPCRLYEGCAVTFAHPALVHMEHLYRDRKWQREMAGMALVWAHPRPPNALAARPPRRSPCGRRALRPRVVRPIILCLMSYSVFLFYGGLYGEIRERIL